MSTFSIGKYKIFKKRIGKGAFSIVYKGIDIETQKVFAIKEIDLDSLGKKKASIKRETSLMRKLKHKNIIKLYDVILDKTYNNIYLVLDYYENGDLTDFLDDRPLKEMYAKKYLRQLSEGLKYLLENNIIHRDLKPQNILMTDNNNIVLTDFGFARYIDASNDVIIQTVCGTPMYMAPEIIKYKKYDIKSDLWSVGVILYQMLFGCTPFKAKNFIDLIEKIDKKKITIPEGFNISNECLDLLNCLLTKNPKDRINWDDFFNHKWFLKDEIMENENKLFDIEIHKNSKLPDLSSFELNKNQFCSFKHKSILVSFDNTSIKKNTSINEETNKEENVEINKEKLNDDDDLCFPMQLSFSGNTTSDDSLNKNFSEDEIFLSIEEKKTYTKPINIINPDRNMFLSNQEFVLVKNDDYNSMSDPTSNQGISGGFKNILHSSINFLKQSYNYLSPNPKSF